MPCSSQLRKLPLQTSMPFGNLFNLKLVYINSLNVINSIYLNDSYNTAPIGLDHPVCFIVITPLTSAVVSNVLKNKMEPRFGYSLNSNGMFVIQTITSQSASSNILIK